MGTSPNGIILNNIIYSFNQLPIKIEFFLVASDLQANQARPIYFILL